MRRLTDFLSSIFLKFTGYSYSNLGRLFIRLFVGVMFLQFGIRHLVNYHELAPDYPTILGLSSVTCLNLMIVIELLCSLLIMIGFLTRLAVIPAICSMIAAEWYQLHSLSTFTTDIYGLSTTQPGYVPIMFIGIFMFIIIAGPGKISVDYFITLFLVGRHGSPHHEEKILHEV